MRRGAHQAAWIVSLGVLLAFAVKAAQTATSLAGVKTVYVESFGNKPGADKLRATVIADLQKSHSLTVVSAPEQADAVLSGTGEIWIKGYYSLNPRLRYVTEDAHPVCGGYLSIELKGRNRETLWSYLVTPRRSSSEAIDRNLAAQMVKKIVEAKNKPM